MTALEIACRALIAAVFGSAAATRRLSARSRR